MFLTVGEIVRSENGSAAIVLGILLGAVILINIVTYCKKNPQVLYRNRRQNPTPILGAALTNFERQESPERQGEVIEMDPLAPISMENAPISMENADQSMPTHDGMVDVSLTPNGSEGSTSSV